jgi:hypothetical protein
MSAIKNISLFIPHVYANFTSTMVFDIIQDMGIGEVKNIDFVSKMGSDGKPYNAVYIHFYKWYDNIVAHNFQERLLDPKKEARIMYDDPWYWLVLENKGKKHVPGQRKPTIDLDAFTTPEKTVDPMSNFRPLNVQRAPKTNSRSLIGKLPAPLNLGNDFNTEAQAVDDKITQEEMDRAFEQMENEQMMAEMEAEMEMDDYHLATFDSRYVQSLEQDNEMLRSQLAYFQNLYNIEAIKAQALVDTIKTLKV